MNAEMCSFLVILALIKFVKTCSEEFLQKKTPRILSNNEGSFKTVGKNLYQLRK